MTEKIIIAGAGGQGVMLLGKVIAQSSLIKGYKVLWFPSYGAEVRGGTANCMVVISSEYIPSPYITNADTLIIMNEPSLIKFSSRILKNGLLIVNSSLINIKKFHIKQRNMKKIYLPFTDLAIKLGDIKVANMIVLGLYVAKKKILTKDSVFAAIENIAPQEKKNLISINKQAIEQGMGLIK